MVWDAPLRLFHWLLALLVVFSYVTAKAGGEWMQWHMRSGYSILSLVLFRIAWGFAGGTTARFASFVRGPGAAIGYLRGMRGRKPVTIGHNPLGGWMVLVMIAALLVQAVSGLFVDDEILTQGPLAAKASGDVVSRMGWIHDRNEWVLVALVGLHVAAIAFYAFILRANLVAPMVHGRAELAEDVAPPRPGSAALAAVLMLMAAGFVYWLVALYPRSPA